MEQTPEAWICRLRWSSRNFPYDRMPERPTAAEVLHLNGELRANPAGVPVLQPRKCRPLLSEIELGLEFPRAFPDQHP